MARPTDYIHDEHPNAVTELARNAKTQLEIAETLGIGITTFKRWLDDHPEFRAAYVLGKEAAVDRVERALFERAIGYSHPTEKILTVAGPAGEGSSIERVETVEHYPPDPAALKFFLTNRRSKSWADKSTVTIGEDRATRLARARERLKKPNGG